MRQEAINLEGYKELEANKGAVLEAAQTLEDRKLILVSKKLFDYLSSEMAVESISDISSSAILAWKTSKTIYFVLDVWAKLGERLFALPTR
jgi:hypothetical protein